MSALNGFLEPGAGTAETVAQLRADLAAREREVEGLKGALGDVLAHLGGGPPAELYSNDVQYENALELFRRAAAALSATPAQARSQAFREGMERAAEIMEATFDPHYYVRADHTYPGIDIHEWVCEAGIAIRAEAARVAAKEQV